MFITRILNGKQISCQYFSTFKILNSKSRSFECKILIQILNNEFWNETERIFSDSKLLFVKLFVWFLLQKFWAKNSVILNTDKRTHKKLILTMRWKLFPKNVWSSDLGFCENHHHVWEIQLVLPKERWYSN